MTNLTHTTEDDLLKRAWMKALERGTSVNAIVRNYLAAYAGEGPTTDALRAFEDIVGAAHSGSGPEGRAWARAELYD